MKILMTFCVLSAFVRADEERLLPAFLEEPKDVTAKIGDRILLPCKIANAEGGLVQWTRDGFGLGGGRETDFPGIRVIGANPESKTLLSRLFNVFMLSELVTFSGSQGTEIIVLNTAVDSMLRGCACYPI